jgi:hypothetical protein
MENDVGTILPAGSEDGTTPEMPTNCKQKGTTKPHRPATTGCEIHSSNANTENEDYMLCILEWLGYNLNWKTVLKEKTMMLAHNNG